MRHLFFITLSSLSLFTFSLQAAAILLDDVMTKDEQKKTGISRLSYRQKVALESWLNAHFTLKTQNTPPEQQLTLSINMDRGERLELSDNSVWEIAPGDVATTSVWLTPFPVKVVPSNDPEYPYLLINTNSGIGVKAKRITAGFEY